MILFLVAISLQAQQCTAQPGILPPMPPLGFFGGLLDGLGLGPSSPPVTSSVPVVSSTYRNPQASPSIQPQDAASASTGTIVPVVSASPATAARAAAAASAVPASPVTPSIPSVLRAPPAAANGVAAASGVPVATIAPASPAAPATPVTVPRAGIPPATPAALRPGETTLTQLGAYQAANSHIRTCVLTDARMRMRFSPQWSVPSSIIHHMEVCIGMTGSKCAVQSPSHQQRQWPPLRRHCQVLPLQCPHQVRFNFNMIFAGSSSVSMHCTEM